LNQLAKARAFHYSLIMLHGNGHGNLVMTWISTSDYLTLDGELCFHSLTDSSNRQQFLKD